MLQYHTRVLRTRQINYLKCLNQTNLLYVCLHAKLCITACMQNYNSIQAKHIANSISGLTTSIWINENVFKYADALLHEKKNHNSTHSWQEADSLFAITLGMPRHTWTHPSKMNFLFLWMSNFIQIFSIILQLVFEMH